MDYQIAVPSYKRSNIVKEKTLKVLEQYKIDPAKVTVFVGNQEEYDNYSKTLKNSPYNNIVIGEVGMCAIRNVIQKHYPENTKIMNFDDDLSSILKRVDDKTLVEVEDLEKEVIFRGFDECEKNNAYMFGIYAVANPFFMNNRTSVGLYFCVGSCWGVINRHDEDLIITLNEKEDYDRVLRHFTKDGKVVRLDDITVKSKYFKEQGGMQATNRTLENEYNNAKYLSEKYPDLCSMYIRKTTNRAEIRLKDKSKTSVNEGTSLEGFF